MQGILQEVYGAVTQQVASRPPEELARPSRAEAWNVKELLFHQLLDAQRALVAFATPTDADVDVDEVTYWRPFRPTNGDGGAAHARFVVACAKAYDDEMLAEQWRSTSAAAVRAAAAVDPAVVVRTQNHAITVANFISTLIVEASVHLLDADATVPPAALAHTLRVLEAINDGPLYEHNVEEVLRATGRLPSDLEAYPLLG